MVTLASLEMHAAVSVGRNSRCAVGSGEDCATASVTWRLRVVR